eukprot:scaffold117319_cov87-Phaeocystis_antarctica.AAC.1
MAARAARAAARPLGSPRAAAAARHTALRAWDPAPVATRASRHVRPNLNLPNLRGRRVEQPACNTKERNSPEFSPRELLAFLLKADRMGAAESSERQAHAGAQPASQGSPHAFHTTVLAIRTLSTRYPRSTLHTHAIPSAGSLKQLTSMGFSEEASKVALEVSAGNLQRAAQMLLEQQDQLGTPRQPAARPGAVPPRQPAAAAARAAFASIPTAAAPRAAPV